MKKQDIGTWNKALRERWPIPDEMREFIVKTLCGIVKTTKDEVMKFKAMSMLVMCEAQNQRERLAEREPRVIYEKIESVDTFADMLKDCSEQEAMELARLRARISQRRIPLANGDQGGTIKTA